MSYVLSKKTVSTAKGVGVSSEKYPNLHLVDVMSDTWYPIPPACARTKTYDEPVALKDYKLEHTKPLFNKNSLLTLQNLYIARTLVELFKILKLQSPISIYNNLKFCPRTEHFKLLCPKFTLGISRNNFTISSILMWNSCINKLIDQPSLSIPNFTHGLALIIPGNVKNSDLTMPKSTFKNRLADYLLELQSKWDHNIWCYGVNRTYLDPNYSL